MSTQTSSNENIIYILPNSLSKNYMQDLKKAAIKNGFRIEENFDKLKTNIVVTNLNDAEQIRKVLKLKLDEDSDCLQIYFVNLKWLTDSNKNGVLSDFKQKIYLVGSNKTDKEPTKIISPNSLKSSLEDFELYDYECQRSTPLKHHNEELTNALEILEEYADFKSTEADDLRALAFRKSICVLKCLPVKITNIRQIKNLKHIGEHTRTVIEDILTFGYSKEVDSILSQEYYQVIKKFNSIYGCGTIVSNRLYELGFRTLDDLRKNHDNLSKKVQNDLERLKYGLTYYDDLTIKKITINECDFIFSTIKTLILEHVSSECIIELMGGFKRGKQTGHDVDFLITHPILGEEKELLTKIIEVLESKGYVVFGKHDQKSHHDWTKPSSKNTIDLFERYISVLKFPVFKNETDGLLVPSKRIKLDTDNEDKETLSLSQETHQLNEILSSLDASKFKRNWIARRIDLIISPIDQFPFAILGWTGSRQFNRSIRLYSDREFGYKLSSHGMYDYKNNVYLKAKEEKDIFDLLKLKYRPPNERNC